MPYLPSRMLVQKSGAVGVFGMIAEIPTTATGWLEFSDMADPRSASVGDSAVDHVGHGVHVGDETGLGRAHGVERDGGGKSRRRGWVRGAADPAGALFGNPQGGFT